MDHSSTISAATDISRFAGLRARARSDGEAAAAEVVREFEALFIQMMLRTAREASMEGGLFNSRELKMYREMLDSQVALSMAEQGGLGLKSVLGRQLGIDTSDIVPTSPRNRYQPGLEAAAPLSFAGVIPKSITPPTQGVGSNTQESIASFVDDLKPHAERAAQTLGIDAEILIAQAALETGWGRHTMAYPDGRSTHNLFGVKAQRDWAGESVARRTTEYWGGNPVTVTAQFRAYPNVESAFNDYLSFIRSQPRYSAALSHGGDERTFITRLHDAGYATDPNYSEKVLDIHRRLRTEHVAAR